MDSILVVCYSYTGVSRRAAQQLCAEHGWPLGEIREAHPRAGAGGYLRCLLDSLLHRHPAIRYDGPDPGDFRTVVLVSPIWGWRLAGPMRSFVASHRGDLRRVAVLSTMGGSGAVNAVAEIGHLLGHPPVHALALLQREVEQGAVRPQLAAFADALQPHSTATQPGFVPAWHAAPTEVPPVPEQP